VNANLSFTDMPELSKILLWNFRNWLSEREMFGTKVVEEHETAFYAECIFSKSCGF
jgi:hypothetical protein